MKRIFVLLCIAGVLSPTIWGQESDARRQFAQVFALEKQGQYDEAIRRAEPLIDSHALSPEENGRAWILLGYAYEQQNRFQEARHAFERSLQAFEGNSKLIADYATALDYFAELYRVMQQPQLSKKLLSRALSIHRQLEDHHSMATTYSNLAETEAELKHVGPAKKFLEGAITEAKSAGNRTDEDNAFICETEAWLASLKGDFRSAIEHAKCSVSLLNQIYGDNYPRTGWAYITLGKAYADNKEFHEALTNMHDALAILERTVGPRHVQFLTGKFLYSQVLDRSGSHDEALRLKAEVRESVASLYRGQCLDCTVSVQSLR